jgi:hypothetical protein
MIRCVCLTRLNSPINFSQIHAIHKIIVTTVDTIADDLVMAGFKADYSDGAYWLEAHIYDYIKRSNPTMSYLFTQAEDYGARN